MCPPEALIAEFSIVTRGELHEVEKSPFSRHHNSCKEELRKWKDNTNNKQHRCKAVRHCGCYAAMVSAPLLGTDPHKCDTQAIQHTYLLSVQGIGIALVLCPKRASHKKDHTLTQENE